MTKVLMEMENGDKAVVELYPEYAPETVDNFIKLVKEGLLIREADPTDRRKVRLSCTKKALPIIEKGRKMQEAFQQALFAHTDEETMQTFVKTLSVMTSNMDTILEGE